MSKENYLRVATRAALEAGEAIMKIYDQEFSVVFKEDRSPLTEADLVSNSIINSHLKDSGIPIISEENRQIDYSVRQQWNTCWIVDPIDGTKEFIKKNGEFTVNIALSHSGKPVLGVIYVPVSRELYYADAGLGKAFKQSINPNVTKVEELYDDQYRIQPEKPKNDLLKVVGSRSHMNQETSDFINPMKKEYDEIEIVSKGSSLKFCLVAEGKAHIYPRFAPTMEWDTAAGQAICEAAGLEVISQDTQMPLLYNKKNLLNPYFVVQHL